MAGLVTLTRALKRPIYWAGQVPGDRYELTQASGGKIYIRYLPPGVRLGADRELLTVGTYPVVNAFAVTSGVARRSDSVRIPLHGGVAFYSKSAPGNIYLAYPGSDYQIEVFDPSPTRAQELVASGRIAPAKTSSAASSRAPAHAVSLTALKTLASTLKHPLYWAGAEQNVTYELTRTDTGQYFIRYLPPGAKVGSTEPYLTIGTYPLANAYETTRRLSAAKTSVRVIIPGSGLAFYEKDRPTNFYLAYPGAPYQVEVYDPSAVQALELVKAGRIGQLR